MGGVDRSVGWLGSSVGVPRSSNRRTLIEKKNTLWEKERWKGGGGRRKSTEECYSSDRDGFIWQTHGVVGVEGRRQREREWLWLDLILIIRSTEVQRLDTLKPIFDTVKSVERLFVGCLNVGSSVDRSSVYIYTPSVLSSSFVLPVSVDIYFAFPVSLPMGVCQQSDVHCLSGQQKLLSENIHLEQNNWPMYFSRKNVAFWQSELRGKCEKDVFERFR